MKKNCLQCGVIFEAEERYIKRGHAKFCSRSCASKFNSLMRSGRSIPNSICALCGKEIYKTPYQKSLSKSGFVFCCRAHKDLAQKIGGIKEIMPSHYGTGTGISTYRAKTIDTNGAKCELCGWDKHISGLVVHHKDRNRLNNKTDNLQVLCACCHAMEHHLRH